MAHDRESKASSMLEEYWALDEIATPAPVELSKGDNLHSNEAIELSHQQVSSRRGTTKSILTTHGHMRAAADGYDIPNNFANLDELASPSPVQNPHERHIAPQEYLEEQRSQEQDYERITGRKFGESCHSQAPVGVTETETQPTRTCQASRFVTELYVVSYLISFSILGTLARLGLQALTEYPGSPVTTSVLWPNFVGSIIMGFLSQDQKLFKNYRGSKNDKTEEKKGEDSNGSHGIASVMAQTGNHDSQDPEIAGIETPKSHNAIKKTIPLYIGLTTGFCGSFTSFSSFIRDIFLELANQPPAVPLGSDSVSASPRNGGYSFMAVLAVTIFTVCLCLSGVKGGAHLGIALERFIPPLPKFVTQQIFDRCAVVFAWALWIGVTVMAIWPPDRSSGPAASSSTSGAQETWRGRVLFSLVFAPPGCLLRFYASIRLNGIISSFPLGTFVVNVTGTAILGICWDLQHARLDVAGRRIGGELVGCQVLQGVQDGFCGSLTTISTWVLEITGLKRKHAYFYSVVSISVGLAFLVVIVGSLVWSSGISPPACS